ncbi:hypothetical protein SFRURICE_000268 [Spodoptera frugiperda]|nr:hypothetical protein SFRURICE_000268 [Spodoptera frugiperda]
MHNKVSSFYEAVMLAKEEAGCIRERTFSHPSRRGRHPGRRGPRDHLISEPDPVRTARSARVSKSHQTTKDATSRQDRQYGPEDGQMLDPKLRTA